MLILDIRLPGRCHAHNPIWSLQAQRTPN